MISNNQSNDKINLFSANSCYPRTKLGAARIIMTLELIDLNDDCLLEIIDLLPLQALTSVALTCHRLMALARRTFSQRYTANHYAISRFPDHVLEAFGPIIESLRIWPKCGTNELALIYESCPQMHRLHMERLKMEVFTKPLIGDIMARLTFLELRLISSLWTEKYNSYIVATMQRCESLTHLILSGISLQPFLSVKYERLRSFSIAIDSGHVTNGIVHQFCLQNPDITSFTLSTSIANFDAYGILALKQLQQLQLINYRMENVMGTNMMDIITKLNELPRLEKLSLNGHFVSLPVLEHLKQLHSLELSLRSIESIRTDEYEELLDMPYSRQTRDEHIVPFDDNDLEALPNDITDFQLNHNGESRITLPGLIEFVQRREKLQRLVIGGFRQTNIEVMKFFPNSKTYFGNEIHSRFSIACHERQIVFDRYPSTKTELWWAFDEPTDVLQLIKML